MARPPCLTLTEHGRTIDAAIQSIPHHYPLVQVDKYVIMPNHIHMILVVEPGGANASVVVGACKSHISRLVHRICPELKLWQESFHDHIIRNQKQYERIWAYIDTNPMRWKKDCYFVE